MELLLGTGENSVHMKEGEISIFKLFLRFVVPVFFGGHYEATKIRS